MSQLSDYLKYEIINLRKENVGVKAIARRLNIARNTVKLWLRRFEETGNIQKDRPGPKPVMFTTVSERHQAIVKSHTEHPSLPTQLTAKQYNVSVQTVKKHLRVAALQQDKPMFCVQEKERSSFSSDKDPLSITQTDSEDDEPEAKRIKYSPLNLQVYQIPAFNTPKSLSIYPTNTLPNFVNNPLNLANPLAFATSPNGESLVKNLHNRYSLPAKLTITPVGNGEVVRYKKNGEVAKKRGPPKGYKRKPKPEKLELSQSFNGVPLQTQNTILSSLLAANNTTITGVTIQPTIAAQPEPVVPDIEVPEGTELVELLLDPEDWFPTEPYKMVFSRKKNPKWKDFPYQCEHCFKGYRVASTLITHAAERHGCVPKDLAIPCPCCPHVSTRRKHHKKHLESHESRKHRIFCLYCLPAHDPSEPFVKEPVKYPYDKFPQYWYASEESLRLHKKRKHPYSGMFNVSWFSTWRDAAPNS